MAGLGCWIGEAGTDHFVFPPERQGQLAAGIPNGRLDIIERAGTTAAMSGQSRS